MMRLKKGNKHYDNKQSCMFHCATIIIQFVLRFILLNVLQSFTSLACTEGKYGQRCLKNCSGQCGGDNPDKCNPINGSCTEGCQAGWTGLECRIGRE